ncbi:MAG: hypothetical protein AABZ44_02990, partial [Elusimicrobiota bacterium]
ITLCAALQNLGPSINYQSKHEELPLLLKLGAAVRPRKEVLLAIDFDVPKDGAAVMHFGTQYEGLGPLTLRAGYNGRNNAASGLTVGFGINLMREGTGLVSELDNPKKRIFMFDYAFAAFGDLGQSHRISVGYGW